MDDFRDRASRLSFQALWRCSEGVLETRSSYYPDPEHNWRPAQNKNNNNNDSNNDSNNESNTSDKSFDHDKEYQKEFEKERKDEDLATNKVQEDHFQLPFQQHHDLLTDNLSKMRSVWKSKKKGTKKRKRQQIQQY